jgi:recombination DNA repair RAD52 pathway protein
VDKDFVIRELQKPLDAGVVKQRDQAGRSLSYIESWWAISEANRIFGHLNWRRNTFGVNMVQCEQKGDKGMWYVSYTATCTINVEGVNRDGTGFGQGIDRDLGKAHESAIKEAESDAMKRALMTFGNPFGLALYDKEQRNVVSEPTPEEVRNKLMKDVASAWKQMGGTGAGFKELKSTLEKKGIDAYDFVHSAMLDQGLDSVLAIENFAKEVGK